MSIMRLSAIFSTWRPASHPLPLRSHRTPVAPFLRPYSVKSIRLCILPRLARQIIPGLMTSLAFASASGAKQLARGPKDAWIRKRGSFETSVGGKFFFFFLEFSNFRRPLLKHARICSHGPWHPYRASVTMDEILRQNVWNKRPRRL